MKKPWMAPLMFAKAAGLSWIWLLAMTSSVLGQPITYHLDVAPGSPLAQHQLTAGTPNSTSTFFPSPSLGSPGDYLITDFATTASTTTQDAFLPANSPLTFNLWMRANNGLGVVYPKVRLFVNSTSGSPICSATGSTAVSTTLTRFTLTCSNTSAVTIRTTDRIYLWTGVSVASGGDPSLNAELDIDGTVGGNYDSTVVVSTPFTPTISGLDQSSASPGHSILISGMHFGTTGATPYPPCPTSVCVTFNGVLAQTTSWGDGSITAIVPTGNSNGNIVVTTYGAASTGFPFTVPQPAISTLTTLSGPGTSVTIGGSNFGLVQGLSTVKFAGVTATTTSWGDTSIAANIPFGVTTGNIVANVGGRDSTGKSFTVPAPVLTGIYPDPARAGTSVSVQGSNLGTPQNTSSIVFSGLSVTPTDWQNDHVTLAVPSNATSGPVMVTVSGQTSNPTNFTLEPPPQINGNPPINPNSGPVGTMVTINGQGFGPLQSDSRVTFTGPGAVGTPFSWSDTSIQVPVPNTAATGPVVVTATGGYTSNGVNFTVTLGPQATGIDRSQGAVGDVITFTGSGFGQTRGSSVVTFSPNVTATSYPSWSPTSFQAVIPPNAASGPITVAINGLPAGTFANFTVLSTGTLAGAVMQASDSTPINGAQVQFLQNGVVKFSATSGTDGSYMISNVVAGPYDARTSATGYGTLITNGVVAVANQTVTQNFSLPSPGAIAGTVTRADGITPIQGATVQISLGGVVSSTATTNSSGNYNAQSLSPAANYSAQGSAPNFIAQTQNSVAVTSGVTTPLNFSLQSSATNAISYVYDDLGRLVAAIDPLGDTAVYNYDPVGNITSIQRRSSSGTSIIWFTPQSGPAGSTTVTISGTGFNINASQNAVQFNGAPAVVNSASATQLKVTVPNGATTGPITVTNTATQGTATSSGNFNVSASPNAPTITSFSPVIALAGTPLTITGTNFNTSVNLNRIRINTTSQLVNSVDPTGTNLGTTVRAGTTSGHIFVSTPSGRAVSQQDFFVPFGSHTVDSVAYTDRFGFGNTKTISLGPNQVGMLLFDANGGQKISLQESNSNFAGCALSLFAPDGSLLTYTDCQNRSFTANLTLDGTYTIGVDAITAAGSMNVTINDISDVTGNIVIDGPTATIGTTVPGQDARLFFSNTVPNQRVVVFASQVTNPSAAVLLVWPDGHYTGIPNITNNPPGQIFFLDTQTLQAIGTYQLWIQHVNAYFGNETLQIKSVPPDYAGTITLDGPSVPIPPTAVGQDARLTFSANAGKKVVGLITNVTNGYAFANLQAANGSLLRQVGISNNPAGQTFFMDTIALPVTGTQTVWIQHYQMNAGGETVQMSSADDYIGTISIDGPSVTTPTSTLGQDVRLSFTTTTPNQRIVLFVSNVTYPGTYANLLKPDGTQQDYIGINNNPGQVFFLNTQVLATIGTYQLFIPHYQMTTGRATLQLVSVPPDFTGTITIGGPSVRVPTTGSLAVGQKGYLTFNGAANQSVTVHLTNSTISNVTIDVFDPQNNLIRLGFGGTQDFNLQPVTLPGTGTYTIKIDPQGSLTGTITVNLTTP